MTFNNWPSTDNYFSFYGLEPVFDIDTTLLKKCFLDKSRSFHPDFFGEDSEAQMKAIEVTAYNNKAYKILSQPVARIKYLISLHVAEDAEGGKLPNDFLMEMMDLNEKIDEFEFAGKSEENRVKIESEIDDMIAALKALLITLVNNGHWQVANSEMLKLNYLERLLSRLTN